MSMIPKFRVGDVVEWEYYKEKGGVVLSVDVSNKYTDFPIYTVKFPKKGISQVLEWGIKLEKRNSIPPSKLSTIVITNGVLRHE